MARDLYYYPFFKIDRDATSGSDLIYEIAPKLTENGIASLVIRRAGDDDPEAAGEVCAKALKRTMLPVIQLHPGDKIAALRNLAETCCLGYLELGWKDGTGEFDAQDVLRLIDGAGRFRLPIDLSLRFAPAPPHDSISEFMEKLRFLAAKYGHIQLVKLTHAAPADNNALSVFEGIGKILAKSTLGVSAEVWAQWKAVREVSNDLGGVAFEMDPDSGKTSSGELALVQGEIDGGVGRLVPRLPLLVPFYRKGWFTFEVGKVLDTWVDRNAFRYYSRRPGWLEE
jgi:hypothetical protein